MTIEQKSEIFKETPIPGLIIINKPIILDERGFLEEFFKDSEFGKLGNPFKGVHGALSGSKPGVIRGIHTEGWKKLIFPITGHMFGAYPDTRIDSPTFGKVYTMEFDNSGFDSQRFALIIPPGVGNSICVIGNEPVLYIYFNEQEWEPSKAKGIAWNDPDFNIKWPIHNPILSERDKSNPTLRHLYPEKFK